MARKFMTVRSKLPAVESYFTSVGLKNQDLSMGFTGVYTIKDMLTISEWLLVYTLTVPVFFAVDIVWLGWLGKGMYRKYMGKLLAPKPNWAAALVFYLLFIFGIVYFAVAPAVDTESVADAALNGALFGGLAYATYDLTNLAVLKGWSTELTIIDIIWGTVLSTSVAVASFSIAMMFV